MDYSKLTIAELREAAKTKGIRNVSAMKKKELAELLENVEKMMHRPVEETKAEAAPKKKSSCVSATGKNTSTWGIGTKRRRSNWSRETSSERTPW